MGSDAVSWIVKELKLKSRKAALRIGNTLLKDGVFAHVTDKHMLKDDFFFYRFSSSGPTMRYNCDHPKYTDAIERCPEIRVLETQLNKEKAQSRALLQNANAEIVELVRVERMRRQRASAAVLGLALVSILVLLSETCVELRIVALGALLGTVPYVSCLMSTRTSSYVCPAIVDEKLTIPNRMVNIDGHETKCKTDDENNTSIESPAKEESDIRLKVVLGSSLGDRFLSFNDFVPHKIETELFSGTIFTLIRNCVIRNDNAKQRHRINQYFAGKRRVSAVFVQGRFKRPIAFNKLLTGQTFARPLLLPAQWIIRLGFVFLRRIAPGLSADISSEKPYLLTPLAAAAQTLHISVPSNSPDLRNGHVLLNDDDLENTMLLGGDFARKDPLSRRSRRKRLSSSKELSRYSYNPKYVYTFGFWQDLFDPATYTVTVPFGTFGIAKYLDGQPIQINAQVGISHISDSHPERVAWRMELGHSSLCTPM